MTTTTRHAASPAPIRHPAGGLVRNLSPRSSAPTVQRPEIVLEARPAIDFLVSLIANSNHEMQELLPADVAWRHAARESLSPSLKKDLVRAFGEPSCEDAVTGWAYFVHVVPRRDVQTVADVVAHAAEVTFLDLVSPACDDECGPWPLELAERHRAGDPDALATLLASVREDVRDGVRRLVEDPEGEIRALRRVLRAWAERYAEVEARVLRMQERDVRDRGAALVGLPAAEFIEQTTNGLRWTADPTVQTVYMTPSYFSRPYNYHVDGEGWHLFAYPLAESALDGDPGAVPPATVRLFRALGDEGRLRILRYLADGDLYLTEIADRMSISKPTAKHHLAQLRAAGLVTVSQAGSLTYYTLRRDRVAEAGPDLTRYLGSPTGS